MQQLHLVGLTTDHTGLILSARRGTKTGKYSIAADEKLLAAVQEARRLLEGGDVADEADAGGDHEAATPAIPEAVAPPPPPPAKAVSSLSPREIQGRLRAGGTVGEIAAAAGVDEEWILRFADPIRAEQARVVERAQGLTFNKSRLGLSAEPLETSVLLNLAERGVRLPADVFAMAWTAFNLHGTSWAVVFSYTSRQRRQTAQWEVDLRSGDLIARNRLASDLGYLEPGRRRRRMEPLEVPGDDESPPSRRRSPPKTASSVTKPVANKQKKKAAGGKRTPTAKGTGAKKAPTKRPVVASRAAANKAPRLVRASAVKKAATAKKAPAGKKAPAAKKAPVARKSPTAEKAPATARTAPKKAPATRKAPASKKAGRQSSPRGRRPAKKPAAKKPALRDTAVAVTAETVVPPAPVLPERPTHLARPPSPMNRTNRAVTLPGRLVGAPSLRPAPPPAPRPRPQPPRPKPPPPGPSFQPRPRPDDGEDAEEGARPDGRQADDPGEAAERPRSSRRSKEEPSGSSSPSDSRGSSRGRRESPGSGGGGDGAGDGGFDGEASPPRARKRRSERRITARDGDQPSVVILSTPAVRRLEPSEEPRRRVTAPPS